MSNMYSSVLYPNMYNLVNMEEAIDISFGKRLREARIARGFTQQAAADAFGISLRGYCRWEKGEREPNFAALIAISKTLGISVDHLLGLADGGTADEC